MSPSWTSNSGTGPAPRWRASWPERGVPLVFFSGGPFRIDIRAAFPHSLLFEKPTDYIAVTRALHDLIHRR